MLHGISILHHPHLHPANLTPINKSHYQHPTLNCLSFPFSSLSPMRLHTFRPLSSLGETKKQQQQPTLSLRKASSNVPQNLKFKNKNKERGGGGDGDEEKLSGDGGGGGGAALKGTILAGLLLIGVIGYGPAGYALFVTVYAGLEILAIPAIPLTMSAGLLFGSFIGTIIASISGMMAATVAILIARYFARERILKLVKGNKMFLAIDKAIGENGFRVVTLLRLSP